MTDQPVPDLPPAPTVRDVLAARRVVSRFMSPTPMYRYAALDAYAGARIWVKHENHTPIAAFKLRGGLALMDSITRNERIAGVITASTGNHGQSIAYAAQAFGVPAVIVVPEGANPLKVKAIEALGAEVAFHGATFDAAKRHGRALSAARGYRFISSGDEPALIAGVGTYVWEILEQVPDLDYLFVPVGGGSGAAGACLVAQALQPDLRIIAVQSKQAPAAYLTWKARAWRSAANQTLVEGLATAEPFMLPQSILQRCLHDFLLIDDEAIMDAVALCFRLTKSLPEPAGASGLAGVLAMRNALQDQQCAIVLSGGNISAQQLAMCLERMAGLPL